MRTITAEEIAQAAADIYGEINYRLNPRVAALIEKAFESERDQAARETLSVILKNAEIAAEGNYPLCQDNGFPLVWVEAGNEVLIEGILQDSLDKAFARSTAQHFLRASVVADPLSRRNSGDNTPVFLHLSQGKGDKVKISVMAKGAGTENATVLRMMRPSVTDQELIDFIVETVSQKGPEACPPLVLGIGLGGTTDLALGLSKKALFRTGSSRDSSAAGLGALEQKILAEVNKLGIGAMGWGGDTTALDVRIEVSPTHIATMPAALSFSCHSLRFGEEEL